MHGGNGGDKRAKGGNEQELYKALPPACVIAYFLLDLSYHLVVLFSHIICPNHSSCDYPQQGKQSEDEARRNPNHVNLTSMLVRRHNAPAPAALPVST